MAATLSISRNGGTAIVVDLPMAANSPVSYKYQLEGEDLSAFTSAYTTSINLPKTHANCKAFNFPDNVGYSAVDTVDKFTYTYSVDLEPSGTFEDYGKCVIGSVTDTININLFSTLANFNTALENATYTSGEVAYKDEDGNPTSIYPNTDFQPCIMTFAVNSGSRYTKSSFWDNDTSCKSTSGAYTTGLFEHGMVDVGMPNGSSALLGNLSIPLGGNGCVVSETESVGDFTVLQAPGIKIKENPEYRARQVKWYWERLFINFGAIIYNTVLDGYTLTISDSAKARIKDLRYIGPRIGDLTDSDDQSTTYNKSIKDYYLDMQGHTGDNDRFGKFHTKDVFAKLEKPGDIIKRVFKQLNIRLRQVSSTTFEACTTEEFYSASSINDITNLIDRTVYKVEPNSFKYSHVIFEGEGLDTAVLASYKDNIGHEFNYGKQPTGYSVTSEKKWFGDSNKYVTSYPHTYTYIKSDVVGPKIDCIGAYGDDASEVDVAGCICSFHATGLPSYILGDASTRLDYFEPFNGYYGNVKLQTAIVFSCLVVGGASTEYPSGCQYVWYQKSPNFVYGQPKYLIEGQEVTDLFDDNHEMNWFKDVKDSLSSSLLTTNVMFDGSYTSISSVINKMFWFDNNYWVIWSIDSFIPNSKEPCEVTFLKVNDISNYLDAFDQNHNTISGDGHVNWTVTVNGESIPTPSSFDTLTGDVVVASIACSSGYVLDYIESNGTTTYFVEPQKHQTMTWTSNRDYTVSIHTRSAYTLTATASTGGSVSPTTATLNPGQDITLTATPNTDYIVQSWTDNGTTTYTHDNEYTITNVQESHNVTVTFQTDACQVTVQAYDGSTTPVTPDAGGNVSVDGVNYSRHLTEDGHYGNTLTLRQRADSGYRFDHWADSNGTYLSADDKYEYTFTSAADSIRAVFWASGVQSYSLVLTSGEGIGNTYGFGTYAAGAQVTINCDLLDGYTFAGWYDGDTLVSPLQQYTYTMPASNKTLQARGTSSGQVVLNFRGVNCTCSPDHYIGDPGETIQVTVTPTSPYSWGNWNDGNTDNPRTFTLVSSQTYTATCYAEQPHTLTFTASEGGSVYPTSYTGVQGSTVQVTATPENFYSFYQWDDGNTDNPRTFTVGYQSTSYEALFRSDLITYTFNGVNCEVYPTSYTGRPGTQVTVYIHPDYAYAWGQWDDGNTDSPRTFTLGSADEAYTASCVPGQKYTLTLDYTGPTGMPAPTLTGAGQYYPDAAVRISSTIPSGYKFVGWYRGTTLITTTRNVYITKLASNETITAHFDEDREIIYRFSATNGSCSPNMYQGWPDDTVEVTVTPIEHYHFVEWDDHSALNPRTFTIGEVDVDWEATCAEDTKYTLTLNYSGPTGMPAPTLSGAGSYYSDTPVRISTTIPTEYAFTGWYRGSTLVTTTRDVYITKLASAETLTAHFKEDREIMYTFNGDHGSCSPSSYQGWPDDTVSVTVTPQENYHFVEWNDHNTSNPRLFTLGEYDMTFTATCGQDAKYTLTLDYTPSSMPAPTLTGAGTYYDGEAVRIGATIPSGWAFVGWFRGTTLVSSTRNIYITKLGSDETLTAHYEEDREYMLTFNGTNCTCTPPYFQGAPDDEIWVSVTPAVGYEWSQWNDGDTNNPRYFAIGHQDDTYTAICIAEDKYTVRTISFPSTTEGTTTGDGRYSVGATVTITATPTEGHSFIAWYDYAAGVAVSYSPTYTFTMTDYNRIFEARFS